MTRPWAIAFAGASLLVAGIVVPQIAGQAAGTGPKFVNFELAGTPPQPPGTSCPGHPNCFNGAAEPAIRAGADGTFYGSSRTSSSGLYDAIGNCSSVTHRSGWASSHSW